MSLPQGTVIVKVKSSIWCVTKTWEHRKVWSFWPFGLSWLYFIYMRLICAVCVFCHLWDTISVGKGFQFGGGCFLRQIIFGFVLLFSWPRGWTWGCDDMKSKHCEDIDFRRNCTVLTGRFGKVPMWNDLYSHYFFKYNKLKNFAFCYQSFCGHMLRILGCKIHHTGELRKGLFPSHLPHSPSDKSLPILF